MIILIKQKKDNIFIIVIIIIVITDTVNIVVVAVCNSSSFAGTLSMNFLKSKLILATVYINHDRIVLMLNLVQKGR